jgi:two-component system sensor histidine kinase UhpB
VSPAVPLGPLRPRPLLDRALAIPLTAKLLVANGAIVAAVALAVAWLVVTRADLGGAPLLLLVVAATGFSLLANAVVVRSALAPLRELERVAAAVEAGDGSARARLGLVRDPQTERVTLLTNRILEAHEAQRATLARLTGREMAGREEERRSVARELREEIGQTCAALAVGLKSLRDALEDEAADRAPLRARADGLVELVRGAYDAVHARAQGLRPSALDDLGLVPALRSAAARWGAELGTSVDVVAEGTAPRPGSPVGTVLYRVAEEAVANAARHGRASYVAVALRGRDGWMELEVADDGGGFDAAAVDPGQALGLLGMRERLALVGGGLTIASSPEEGTVLRARVPLADERGATPEPVAGA